MVLRFLHIKIPTISCAMFCVDWRFLHDQTIRALPCMEATLEITDQICVVAALGGVGTELVTATSFTHFV